MLIHIQNITGFNEIIVNYSNDSYLSIWLLLSAASSVQLFGLKRLARLTCFILRQNGLVAQITQVVGSNPDLLKINFLLWSKKNGSF